MESLDECMLLHIKRIAFRDGSSEAWKYCKELKESIGSRNLSKILVSYDPIFFGVLWDNPWDFIENEKCIDGDLGKTIPTLFCCGWNIDKIPPFLLKTIRRRPPYSIIMREERKKFEQPWKIPKAKAIVADHYFDNGLIYVGAANLLLMSKLETVWFEKYVKYLKGYTLADKQRCEYWIRISKNYY